MTFSGGVVKSNVRARCFVEIYSLVLRITLRLSKLLLEVEAPEEIPPLSNTERQHVANRFTGRTTCAK